MRLARISFILVPAVLAACTSQSDAPIVRADGASGDGSGESAPNDGSTDAADGSTPVAEPDAGADHDDAGAVRDGGRDSADPDAADSSAPPGDAASSSDGGEVTKVPVDAAPPDAATADAGDASVCVPAPCYARADGTPIAPGTLGRGPCKAGKTSCTPGSVGVCVGAVGPTTEACNGVDDDCNGAIDDINADACPKGSPSRSCSDTTCAGAAGTQTCEQCQWTTCVKNGGRGCVPGAVVACTTPGRTCAGSAVCAATCAPGAACNYPPEICDGVDNNCDSQIDEGLTASFCPDGDGDGYCTTACQQACNAPAGYRAEASCTAKNDCNDGDPNVHTGAAEVCDGVDNDCNGTIDDYNEGRCASFLTGAVGHQIAWAPAIATQASNKLDIFGVRADGKVWQISYNSVNSWSSWSSLDAPPPGLDVQHTDRRAMGAVSDQDGNIDIVVVGKDQAVWQRHYGFSARARTWGAWQSLGGTSFVSGASIASWAPNRLDVFTNSYTSALPNALEHNWLAGAGWMGWEVPAPGTIFDTSSAVGWGNGNLEILFNSFGGTVEETYGSAGWSAFHNVSFSYADCGNAAVVQSDPSLGVGGLYAFLFAAPYCQSMIVSHHGASSWGAAAYVAALAPSSTMQGYASMPSVVSWAPGRFDLVLVGFDGNMWHQWNDGAWHSWESLGHP